MTSRRVVVTGMGALTPIGNDLESYWNGLISGTSGCANITHFDATNFKTKFACELKGFDPADHFEKKEFRRYDRFSQYGIVFGIKKGLNLGVPSPSAKFKTSF